MSETKNITQDPNGLFNAAMVKLGLTTDSALAGALGVPATFISKIRRHKYPLGPSTLLRLHDVTGMEIRELKQILNAQSAKSTDANTKILTIQAATSDTRWSMRRRKHQSNPPDRSLSEIGTKHQETTGGGAERRNSIQIDVHGHGINVLLDTVISILGVKNDAALAQVLGIFPGVISKVRHSKIPLGPAVLLRLHEETGISTRELKSLLIPSSLRGGIAPSNQRASN